jgi:D-aminopeptidase
VTGPRARDLGIPFGGVTGPWNAITDVPGVEVGYQTLIEGDSVRTGVTAIHPRGAAGAGDPVAAGFFSQNGNGEMTGVSWSEESGTFSGPIGITNTHAVGVVHAAIVAWTVRHHRDLAEAWLLPVAAETWDGYLNDINGHHVTEETGTAALEAAVTGPVAEGSVGGGTGMNCYQFKAGSGSSSRLVSYAGTSYAVGVFVQANFGSREELTLAGRQASRATAGRRQPDGRFSLRAARVRLRDSHRGYQRAAPAPAVQGAGAAGDPRAGAHRHDRVALLRRLVPGLLHRQSRRDHAGRHGAGGRGPRL